MSRRQSLCDSRGFTLIEILVAFAILAIALVALFQGFSSGIDGGRRVERASAALLVARSTLERIGGDIPLQEGRQEGIDPNGIHWAVEIQRSASQGSGNLPGLAVMPFEIRVTASAPGAQPITLTTLRLGPATSGSP